MKIFKLSEVDINIYNLRELLSDIKKQKDKLQALVAYYFSPDGPIAQAFSKENMWKCTKISANILLVGLIITDYVRDELYVLGAVALLVYWIAKKGFELVQKLQKRIYNESVGIHDEVVKILSDVEALAATLDGQWLDMAEQLERLPNQLIAQAKTNEGIDVEKLKNANSSLSDAENRISILSSKYGEFQNEINEIPIFDFIKPTIEDKRQYLSTLQVSHEKIKNQCESLMKEIHDYCQWQSSLVL